MQIRISVSNYALFIFCSNRMNKINQNLNKKIIFNFKMKLLLIFLSLNVLQYVTCNSIQLNITKFLDNNLNELKSSENPKIDFSKSVQVKNNEINLNLNILLKLVIKNATSRLEHKLDKVAQVGSNTELSCGLTSEDGVDLEWRKLNGVSFTLF